MQQKKDASLFGLGVGTTFASGLLPFPFNLCGIGIGVLVSGLGVMEVIERENKYNQFFMKAGICDRDNLPVMLSKKKTDYGRMLVFTLPMGKSLTDFTKEGRLERFQQYLNCKRIIASYNNKRIFFKIIEEDIDHTVLYKFIKTSHILELPVGAKESDKSMLMTKLDDKKPHILVGGEIGGGKSAWIIQCLVNIIKNAMTSKKYSNLVINIIDFKTVDYVEFYGCKYIKNMIHELNEANTLFSFLIKEMNRRYKLLNEMGVRHIDSFNEKAEIKLPHIITVIDEFADITNCMNKDLRKIMVANIHELLRKSRAVGIHLIIGLQRPDKDNLPGSIKSLLPARIGFRTSDAINSRIILDCDGAENLRGAGHGIYKFDTAIEFQGMYIKEGEVYELIKDSYIEQSEEFDPSDFVNAEYSVMNGNDESTTETGIVKI